MYIDLSMILAESVLLSNNAEHSEYRFRSFATKNPIQLIVMLEDSIFSPLSTQ